MFGIPAVKILAGVAAFNAVCALVLFGFAQYWRAEAKGANAQLELAVAQGAVLGDKLQACNAGVDQAKLVGDAAIAAMGELLAKARKLAGHREKTIERIETVIHQAPKPGEGCDWAWDQIERERRAQ